MRNNNSNKNASEQWRPVQVAAYAGLSYQTARNQMLGGIFGASRYDPASRALTVSAETVRRVCTKREASEAED